MSGCSFDLWVGEGSLAEVATLRQQLADQRAELKDLHERNATLQAEVDDLKEGLAAIEARARSELGLIRQGETYFQLLPPAGASTMTDPSFWAVVPAAGVGRRMGGADAQTIPRTSRPQGHRSHDRAHLLHPAVDGLYLALGEDDGWWEETEFAGHPELVRVCGGVERCHSVFNALEMLGRRAHHEDWVLVHDAARPCVRRSDIDRLIDAAGTNEVGGLLGMPVRDTMKRTDTKALGARDGRT